MRGTTCPEMTVPPPRPKRRLRPAAARPASSAAVRRAPMRSSLVAWRGRANIARREGPKMQELTVGFRGADGSKQPVLVRDVTLYARFTACDLMPSAWRQCGLSYARWAIRHRGAAVWSGVWVFVG